MKLAILGGGNLGLAIALGCWKAGVLAGPADIMIIEMDDARRALLLSEHGLRSNPTSTPEISSADAVILAVKPLDFEPSALSLRNLLTPRQVVVSVMAGITTASIEKHLCHANVARTMPNLAVLVGRGMTGWFARSDDAESIVTGIFSSVGTTCRVEREDQLDVVTALSGSGPGYLCLIFEQMIAAGLARGLSREQAQTLVLGTVDGTAALLASGESLESLRSRVTSKGGTTAAAIQALEANGVSGVIDAAVAAAIARSRELSR